jgi:hypothetical protein
LASPHAKVLKVRSAGERWREVVKLCPHVDNISHVAGEVPIIIDISGGESNMHPSKRTLTGRGVLPPLFLLNLATFCRENISLMIRGRGLSSAQ